jgi:hypothetical protein
MALNRQTRRAMLLGSTAFTAIAVLVGCANTATTTSASGISAGVQQALTIGQTIDAGLMQIVTDAEALLPNTVTASAANAAEGYLSEAGTDIAALLGMKAPPPGATTTTVLATYFEDAMDLVAPVLSLAVPEAAPVIAAIDAIDALLPTFEALVDPTPTAAIAKRADRLARRTRPRVAMSTQTATDTINAYLAAAKTRVRPGAVH